MWNQVQSHLKSQKIKVTLNSDTMAISLKTCLKRDIFSCFFQSVIMRYVMLSWDILCLWKETPPLILVIKYIFDTIIVSDSVDPLN